MTKRIGIQDSTYRRLQELKSPGQSFNGVILELLENAGMEEDPADLPDHPGVYLVRRGEQVLYVGRTESIRRQVEQRIITNDTAITVEYEVIEDKRDRRDREQELIDRYNPRHNAQRTGERDRQEWRIIIE